MKRLLPLFFILAHCLALQRALADVKLPAIFSDHMVLQRDVSVPVWGWADPGEQVSISIAGQTQTTKADNDGRWMAKLNPLAAASQPQTLMVRGNNALTVQDVLIGETWLASGQSNMALTVEKAQDFEREKAAAQFPQLRMFTVSGSSQPTPQSDCHGGKWVVCTPETVGKFSAVAYFFGRELHRKLGVPVGLINSSVGGTDIAAWTSEEAQARVPELKALIDKWAQDDAAYDPDKAKTAYEKDLGVWKAAAKAAEIQGKKPPLQPRLLGQPRLNPNRPANLYNGMIAPLIPYAIRGVIWYQGEHNTAPEEAAFRYRIQLPLLVEDWRARWANDDLPFAWVQLPNFNVKGDGRPLVREAMLQSLRLKNTGMAVTIDIGEGLNNHPKNKQEVGRRLSLWALGTVYGQPVTATSGPLPAGHEIRNSEIVLSFKHTEGGLVAKGGPLTGFFIAGEDKKWVKAIARIEGDTVVVSHPDVKHPLAVRYAWAGNPECNLYNGAGLPASPFRTDDWR